MGSSGTESLVSAKRVFLTLSTSDSDLICDVWVVTTCAEQAWMTQGQSSSPCTCLHTSTAPLFSSVMPAEYLQEWEKTLVLTETKSASLMAAVSSPRCRYQPRRVYFAGAGKNQNAAAKALVRAGGEHHQAQPAVWGVWGLLLGLCAPHCPCSHSAFCSLGSALGTGITHAGCHRLHCPSRASAPRSWRLLSCAKRKKAAKQAQPRFA